MPDDVEWIGSASVNTLPITVDDARSLLTYSRDSSERVVGVWGQEGEVIDWAERNGYTVVGHFRDVHVHSMSPAEERRGLSEAVKAIEEGRAAGVAVTRLDRLARSWDVQDDAVRRIWNAGGRLFSIDYGEWKPDHPGDTQWRFRRDEARRAEEEFYALLEKLQKGRRQKMALGGYGGGNRYARRYGVELVEIQGRLEYRPVPSEQAVVRRIEAACADGKGYADMARTLNAEGVPTVTGSPWSRKTVRALALRGTDRPMAVPEELTAVPSVPTVEWRRLRAVG